MGYEIKEANDIEGLAVMDLAVCVAEELEAEFGTPHLRAAVGDHALWIEHCGEIASFIVWREWTDENTAWIGIGWTRPALRGLGMYRELYERLKTIAKERGFAAVGCGISPKNKTSHRIHQELGLVATQYAVQL